MRQIFGSMTLRQLPVILVFLTLAACGDPLAGVGRLSQVDIAPEDTTAAALPDAEEIARDGFLGTTAAEGPALEDVASTPEASEEETTEGGGFLSGLIKRVAKVDAAEAIAADVASAQSEAVIIETIAVEPAASADLVSLPVEPEAPQEEAKTGIRGLGLFNGGAKKSPKRTGPDVRDVPFGTVLAFGEIARSCDSRGKSLGKKVDGSGRRGFTLYDSKPGVRDKHTFYVTGFSDNCPRQFTAANALFGKPSFYEQIRYSPAGKYLPYAATDTAYDKVKSSICRTGKKKPCGQNIGKLDSHTAFVSAYEFSEHNGQWKEFLVHDGEVLAAAIKKTK